MSWLAAASGSCLLFLVTALGTFVPLKNAGAVNYLFAGPPISTLLFAWAIAVALLLASYVSVVFLARSRSRALVASARAGRWLSAFAPLGLVALGVVPAAPGIGERGSVVGYFCYDLRWWWLAAAIGVSAYRAQEFVGAPIARIAANISRWSPQGRLLFQDSTLFAVGVIWAIVSLPLLRFQSALHGDEPKYLRYCETWYQGGGLDVSAQTPVAELPLDARPALFRNISGALEVLPVEARALEKDLGAFASDPTHFRWNRVHGSNAFTPGKDGGTYQLHQPGTSLVLFPGYFLDRFLLTTGLGPDRRWPSPLPMTNAAMLFVYGACGVALFRLLKHALQSEALAWLWSAIAMVTLPTTAFAFQFYPELPALLIVLVVSNYLIFGNRTHMLPAAIAGVAAGAMIWLHVRFTLVIATFVIGAIATRQKATRRIFVGAVAALVLSELAFEYHVTGSWLPSARYDAVGEGASYLNLRLLVNTLGYFFDRTWGLFPNALLLLAAAPGLLLLARESPRRAFFVAAVSLALIVTAAGHSLNAGGTTPDRLVVAIVGLLIWPVALFVKRVWSSEAWRAVVLTTVMLTVQAALAYNWHHDKSDPTMIDASSSGWKPNLAFPILPNFFSTSLLNKTLLGVWISAICLAIALALRRHSTARTRTGMWLIPCTIVGFIAFFSATTAANQDWTHDDYLQNDAVSRQEAAAALLALDRCRVCFSSDRGQTDWARFSQNAATGGHAELTQNDRTVDVHLWIDGPDAGARFGRATINFGDASPSQTIGVLAERIVRHPYSTPGRYSVMVTLDLGTRTLTLLRENVDIK